MNPSHATSWRTIGSITLAMALLITLTGIGVQLDSAAPPPTAAQLDAKTHAAKTHAAQRPAVRAELQRQARLATAALAPPAGIPTIPSSAVAARPSAIPAGATASASSTQRRPRILPIDYVRRNRFGMTVSAVISRHNLTDPATGRPTGSRQVIRLANLHAFRPRIAPAPLATPLGLISALFGGLPNEANLLPNAAGLPLAQQPLPPAGLQICNGVADVQVLATELSYGTAGADVPLGLDYQIGAGPLTPVFAAPDLQGLETQLPPANAASITIAQAINFGSDIITFTARSAFPSFANPTALAMNVRNDDPNNALLLINGDNLAAMLSLKGVQNPLAGQMDIGAVLAAFLDAGGNVVLSPNEILALFELGTTNLASPAFDFQDLIVKITLPCAVAADLVVRDTIGVDGAFTADPMTGVGLQGFQSWSSVAGGIFWGPGSSFVSPVSGTLSTLITNNFGEHNSGFNFSAWTPQEFGPNTFTWQVKIWDGWSLAETPGALRPFSEPGPTGQGGPQKGYTFNINPNLFPIDGLSEVGTPRVDTTRNFT